MPISEKILSEIDKLDTDIEVKKLMKDLLWLEDDGVRRWNIEYEAKIKEYINKKEENES